MKPMKMNPLMDNEVRQLSGGELQRVAFVIALGTPADLYLIDEPSAYLDSEQRISAAKEITRSNCVLEAFGNTRTVMNDNLSRFGKFLEMSYDCPARLLGGTV